MEYLESLIVHSYLCEPLMVFPRCESLVIIVFKLIYNNIVLLGLIHSVNSKSSLSSKIHMELKSLIKGLDICLVNC